MNRNICGVSSKARGVEGDLESGALTFAQGSEAWLLCNAEGSIAGNFYGGAAGKDKVFDIGVGDSVGFHCREAGIYFPEVGII